MTGEPAAGSRRDAFATYTESLRALNHRRAVAQRADRRLGMAKLVVAILAVGMVVALLRRPAVLGWSLVPIALFVLLAILHSRVIRSLRAMDRPIDFYTKGLARLDHSWTAAGETGERFLNPLHPYARDLDLFGAASLFALLCTARTRAGEETLAGWLLTPAPPPVVRERQAAVRELAERISFRERLWASGETVRGGVHPDALSAWGERKPSLSGSSIRVLASVLAVLWVLSIVAWAVLGWGWLAALATVVNLVYAYSLHKRLDEAAAAMEAATKDLQLLANVLQLLEGETLNSLTWNDLQDSLRASGGPPSTAIAKLGKLAQYLESRRNPLARALDLVTFWTAHLLLASERWQARHGASIRGWLAAVGECEALSALSGYTFEHPYDIFPELLDGPVPVFHGEGLAHPLLPAASAVRNDLALGDPTRLVIISGPNMAGKSTFIRSVGINIVLAQCGAPVRARRLALSPLAVGTSICILDSLQGGASRFYAEISRVKLISDLAGGPLPVLFLLDELLSGTNSNDRLAGTDYVVRSLLARGAIGMVSTHDLALTRLPETLNVEALDPGAPVAVNCHFEDRLNGRELAFDYTLKPGIVETSNALALMRSIGLGVPQAD